MSEERVVVKQGSDGLDDIVASRSLKGRRTLRVEEFDRTFELRVKSFDDDHIFGHDRLVSAPVEFAGDNDRHGAAFFFAGGVEERDGFDKGFVLTLELDGDGRAGIAFFEERVDPLVTLNDVAVEKIQDREFAAGFCSV